MEETLTRGMETYSPDLLTLLKNRLDTCRNILAELEAFLADLSPELISVHERLVSILRSISAANTRQKVGFLSRVLYRNWITVDQFPVAEVEGFRDQLKQIKGTMVDGKFLAEDSTTPAGQALVVGLLEKCFLWSDIVLTRCVL